MVPRWVTHISCHYKNTIAGVGGKRTNEQKLGVNSRVKRGVMQHYLSDSIYGLTLAWITSENSTKLPECRLIFSHCGWTLSHAASPLCSGVHCRPPLSVFRRQLLVNSFSQLTLFRVPLPLPATPRFRVQKPFVWFRAKTDKGIVCLAGHLYSVTNGNAPALEFPGSLRPKLIASFRSLSMV